MKKTIAILLTMLLMVAMPLTAFAAPGDSIENIPVSGTVSPTSPGKGSVSIADKDGKPIASVQAGDIIMFTATPENGAKFSKWVITGEYEIVEGSLNSSVIKVRVKNSAEGVKAEAVFTQTETTTVPGSTSTTTPPTTNGSSTAPNTGSTSVASAGVAVTMIGLAGVACIIAAKKKER